MVSGQLKSIQRLLVMKISKKYGVAKNSGRFEEMETVKLLPILLYCFEDLNTAREFAENCGGNVIFEIDLILCDNLGEALV